MRNLKPKRLSCLTFKEITKGPGKMPGPQTVDKALLLQGFAILLEPLF